jgi:glutamate synthase (NADPH) small chain
VDSYQQVRLIIDPNKKQLIEDRRIKEEDIKKTIFHAEQSGQKFIHPGTGHFLAGVRPYFVTVWVEYTPREDGFEIHSAYQHRVKITGEEIQ